MQAIALEIESAMTQEWFPHAAEPARRKDLQSAIAHAVHDASRHPEVSVIVTPSARGTTPMAISRLRPDRPILMLTENEQVARRFSLIWGVIPERTRIPDTLDQVFRLAADEAGRRGLLPPGKAAVITAGFPLFGTPTNLFYVYKCEHKEPD